jgi:2-oxoglutarate dehydrogenase E1 component
MSQDFGVNQGLVEELYLQYRANPASVSEAWRKYFDGLDEEPLPPRRTAAGITSPGRLTSPGLVATPSISGIETSAGSLRSDRVSFAPGPDTRAATELQSRVSAMVNAYRVRGHLFADLDPLDILPRRGANRPAGELGLATFGLVDVDLDTPFNAMAQTLPLRAIVARLEETYCRTIGVEFTHSRTEERDWLQTRMESTGNHLELTASASSTSSRSSPRPRSSSSSSTRPTRRRSASRSRVARARSRCSTSHRAWASTASTRSSSAWPTAAASTCSSTSWSKRRARHLRGLRGQGRPSAPGPRRREVPPGLLDRSQDRERAQRAPHAGVQPEPPRVREPGRGGRVRAKQDRKRRHGAHARVPLLIHGDAAFIGQGIVAETLNLASLEGYSTGGTIHVVINNQVGFTTDPKTPLDALLHDITRMLKLPRVPRERRGPGGRRAGGDARGEYRQRFHKDVVIDLYCYRKYGHNEGDEPRFTQPLMYAAIDKKPTVRRSTSSACSSSARSPGAGRRHRRGEPQGAFLDDALERGPRGSFAHVRAVAALVACGPPTRGRRTRRVADTSTRVEKLRRALASSPRCPRASRCTRASSAS